MVYSALEPFLIANGYGLFRDMTGVGPSVLDSHGRVVAQVMVQHTATHCNTLQHTLTHGKKL